MKRMRTPRSWSSWERRTSSDSLKFIRNRTSAAGRRQFSVEKAYTVSHDSPTSKPPSTVSNRAASPASWPLLRGRPLAPAQRPLPSITMAT
jgi:hypothetical protein